MGGLATKHNVNNSLLTKQDLRQYVPETTLFSKPTLKVMLNKYGMVYVKPNKGTGGKGVFRVEKEERDYKYQFLTVTETFHSFADLTEFIGRKIKNSSYVIQKGVHLLRHDGRLFDLRVMVQKNPQDKWETTGIIGRVGHPKKIVTNVCRGGYSIPVKDVLKKHVPSVPYFVKKLSSLCLRAALQLNKSYPRLLELGFDIGIDQNLHPWILEANPRPAIYGFKELKDKSIYSKMYQNQRRYEKKAAARYRI